MKLVTPPQPADPVRFIEECVVSCNDPEQQAELLERFRWKLRRAFKRRMRPGNDQLWDCWADGGRRLRLAVCRSIVKIQPPARRVLYGDVARELSEEFEAVWKRR